MSEALVSIYRISDCFQNAPSGAAVTKPRPPWFDKKKCFLNFLSAFGTNNLFVIADGVGQQTFDWLATLLPTSQIVRTEYKSGAASFLHAARMAAKFPAETKLVLAEDDYVWTPDAKQCIIDGLDIGDYVSPFDAGDKYIDANTVGPDGCVGNPLVSGRSEVTRVYLGRSCHFKLTNSTTCTWAAKAKTIKADLDIYNAFCVNGFPHDYQMFRHLLTHKARTLVSPLPSKATHCEAAYLAPLIDWQRVLRESQYKCTPNP